MKTMKEMLDEYDSKYPDDKAKLRSKVKVKKKKLPPKTLPKAPLGTGLANKARKLIASRQRNVDNAVKSALK